MGALGAPTERQARGQRWGTPAPIPVPLTPLFGREQELATVRALLSHPEVRLLTVTGPGGVGKTRLVLELAAELATSTAAPVVWVPLAAIGQHADVAAAIAQALGIPDDAEPVVERRLSAVLRDQAALLVLDNFEHLIAAAPLVGRVLEACAGLRLLVTSRAPLRLRGERVVAVPPLADEATAPASLAEVAASPAVALFVSSAQAGTPDWRLTDANAADVAAICRLVDGLPLALELAAARLVVWPPDALRHRLAQRLRTLTDGPHDLPPRQHTLRATLAWSYELLLPAAQQLFARLGVFRGGATFAAIAHVCTDGGANEDVSVALSALVHASLLQRHGESGSEATGLRFSMLELAREYALEQLARRGEVAMMEHAHAYYFLRLAETAEPELHGPTQALWLQTLAADDANLHTALAWSASPAGDGELGVRLAGALWWYWAMRGHMSAGQHALDVALRGSVTPTSVAYAKALAAAGKLAEFRGDILQQPRAFVEAEQLLTAAYERLMRLGDTTGAADAQLFLGRVARDRGQRAVARRYLEGSIRLFTQGGHEWGLVWAHLSLGDVALDGGDHEEAHSQFTMALELGRTLEDGAGIVAALSNLGRIAVEQRQIDQATAYYHACLAVYQQLGDAWGVAESWLELGRLAHLREQHQTALECYGQTLSLLPQLEELTLLPLCLEAMAATAAELGYVEQATRLQRSTGMHGQQHDTHRWRVRPASAGRTEDHDSMRNERRVLQQARMTLAWLREQAGEPNATPAQCHKVRGDQQR